MAYHIFNDTTRKTLQIRVGDNAEPYCRWSNKAIENGVKFDTGKFAYDFFIMKILCIYNDMFSIFHEHNTTDEKMSLEKYFKQQKKNFPSFSFMSFLTDKITIIETKTEGKETSIVSEVPLETGGPKHECAIDIFSDRYDVRGDLWDICLYTYLNAEVPERYTYYTLEWVNQSDMDNDKAMETFIREYDLPLVHRDNECMDMARSLIRFAKEDNDEAARFILAFPYPAKIKKHDIQEVLGTMVAVTSLMQL